MSSSSASDALRDLLEPSASSPSSLPVPPASCSASALPQSFVFTQEAAEALHAAAEAKAVLDDARRRLEQATAVLDELVATGLLPEKGLPVVSGYALYRQEGRASWTYPPAIQELEAQLRKRKQLAEQLGEASQKRGSPFWTIKEASPLRAEAPLPAGPELL